MRKFITLAKGLGIGVTLLTTTTTFATVPEHTYIPQAATTIQQLSTALSVTYERGCLPTVSGEFESETATQARSTTTGEQIAGVYVPTCGYVYTCGPFGCGPVWVCG